MRFTSASIWLAALTLAACGGGSAPVQIDPNAAAQLATRWNGRLSTPSSLAGVVQVQGDTWLEPNGDRTVARVDIRNAAPGGSHPWHVHRGQCGYDRDILGKASAYPMLKVNKDGKAGGRATLDTSLPNSGDYYIDVHASATNLSTIVACGNLAAPTRM